MSANSMRDVIATSTVPPHALTPGSTGDVPSEDLVTGILGRLTRRRLLVAGGAAALTAGLSGSVATRAMAAPSWLSRSSYTGRLGQAFAARPAGRAATWLKLVAVDDLIGTDPGGGAVAGRDDAFLLRFERTSGPDLEQGQVELRNKDLGRATLFVVPDGTAGTYALVVNRCA